KCSELDRRDRSVCVLKDVLRAARSRKRRASETQAAVEVRGLASIVTEHYPPAYSFRSAADKPVNVPLARRRRKCRRSACQSTTCALFSKLACWSCGCTAPGCHVQLCGQRSSGSSALFRRSW